MKDTTAQPNQKEMPTQSINNGSASIATHTTTSSCDWRLAMAGSWAANEPEPIRRNTNKHQQWGFPQRYSRSILISSCISSAGHVVIADSHDPGDVGAMDYAPMHVINSPPQDTSARKVSTADDRCHSSHDHEQLNDEIMVTKATNGQTFVIGVLSHRDDTQDSDMGSKSDTGKSTNGDETKIKLNFSVDRLLGVDCGSGQAQRIVISTNNNGGGGSPNHGQYDCCKYLGNGQRSHLDGYHVQKQNQAVVTRERGVLLPPSMDIKAVVRPTPIRALGNGADDVLSYSSMASSIHKFHQQQQQHHHHHHSHQQQQQQQPSAASIAALSSLMAPFNGLKSLQINQQHFRQQANIQLAAKSLDIPPTTQPTNGGNVSGSVGATTAPPGVIGNSGKRKRSWSRAVFSNLQRKGLEIQFQQQKYITKPDRRKLAARLNLTDAQVKVWFQNRRMKWRHTRENLKSGQEKPVSSQNTSTTTTPSGNDDRSPEKKCYTSSSDSDDDEIDVVE